MGLVSPTITLPTGSRAPTKVAADQSQRALVSLDPEPGYIGAKLRWFELLLSRSSKRHGRLPSSIQSPRQRNPGPFKIHLRFL